MSPEASLTKEGSRASLRFPFFPLALFEWSLQTYHIKKYGTGLVRYPSQVALLWSYHEGLSEDATFNLHNLTKQCTWYRICDIKTARGAIVVQWDEALRCPSRW